MDKLFKYIQTHQIETLSGGDSDFQKELVDIFREQIDEFVGNMKKYLESEEWTKLAKEAHTAKSSALTFGMNDTGKLLKEIQLEAEALSLEHVPYKVKTAIEHLESAIPELNEYKASL